MIKVHTCVHCEVSQTASQTEGPLQSGALSRQKRKGELGELFEAQAVAKGEGLPPFMRLHEEYFNHSFIPNN